MTELCDIAYKYGTDKCPQVSHNYTPFYHELLSDRRYSINKVLELGIGEAVYRSHMNHPAPVLGASLKMWRDYFPNARIYGVDISEEAMFDDERIQTFKADATSQEDLSLLIKEIGDNIDLIVDDASHKTNDQILTCRLLMGLVRGGVTYVIEDVKEPEKVLEGLKDFDSTLIPLAPITGRHRKWNNLIIVYHSW